MKKTIKRERNELEMKGWVERESGVKKSGSDGVREHLSSWNWVHWRLTGVGSTSA